MFCASSSRACVAAKALLQNPSPARYECLVSDETCREVVGSDNQQDTHKRQACGPSRESVLSTEMETVGSLHVCMPAGLYCLTGYGWASEALHGCVAPHSNNHNAYNGVVEGAKEEEVLLAL